MKQLLFAMGFAVAIFAGQVQAGMLQLTYKGVLEAGSNDPSNNDLSGLPFELTATFDSMPYTTASSPDQGFYRVTNAVATVDGVTYNEINPNDFYFLLVEPSGGIPFYFAILGRDSSFFPSFAPFFITATPAIEAEAASPTVFSNFLASNVYHGVSIDTDTGTLNLVYSDSEGLSAFISTVPEPSSLAMLGLGGTGLLFATIRRRRMAKGISCQT